MTRQKKAAGKRAPLPNPLAGGKKRPLGDGNAKTRAKEMMAIIAASEEAVLDGKDMLSYIFQTHDIAGDSQNDEYINVGVAADFALHRLLRNEKSRGVVVDALLERLVGTDLTARAEAINIILEVFESDEEKTKTFIIQKITAFMHSNYMVNEMEKNSPAYTRAAQEIANLFDVIIGKFDPTPEEVEQTGKITLKALGLTEADIKEAEAYLKGRKK
jgi:hypothetical protein